MVGRTKLALMAGGMASLSAFAVPAGAQEVIAACTSEQTRDPAKTLAEDVRTIADGSLDFKGEAGGISLAGSMGFADPEYMPGEDATVWHIQQNLSVPTDSWNDEERDDVRALLAKLPPCLRAKAGIGQAYRVRRGMKSSQVGFKGIVYSWQNRGYSGGYTGGRTIVADLFFGGTSYNGRFSGDEQMQLAMGWEECQPPADVAPLPNEGADSYNERRYGARLASLDPKLRAMSRERILFHEYIHGVTHQQKGVNRLSAHTFDGFFGPGGPSRMNGLLSAHLGDGSPFQKLHEEVARTAALPPSAANRAAYCAAVAKRNEYLATAEPSIPQRWPGDLHALESKDEYVTILIETAMYDPTGGGYSPEEIAWAHQWWQETFGAPMGQCALSNVASNDGTQNTTPPDATMAYVKRAAAKAVEETWAKSVLGWFWR